MLEQLQPADEVGTRPTDPVGMRYVQSFLRLRIGVGALAILLPPALVIVDGLWFNGGWSSRDSLSDYYYSGARELFVGTLCAVGVFLIAYKVAEKNLDNTLSGVAGVAAVGVALFPTNNDASVALTPLQDELTEGFVAGIHYGCAVVFISLLAALSVYFGIREGKRPARQTRRPPRFWRDFHWICAGVIGAALLFMLVAQVGDVGPKDALFIGETVAVLAFAVSWLAKGAEWDMLRGRPALEQEPEAPRVAVNV
jgi:hypothetical protein